MVQVDVNGDLGGRVCLATRLADRFQSHLIGISAWMPRPPFTVEGVMIDPELTAADLRERTAVLNRRGEEFKAAAGIDGQRVEWRCSQEFPSEYIAREARAADLVIVSRERDVYDPYVFPDPGALMLRSGRPILAVPPGVDSLQGRRVVVAWNDTREARRAIRDALPFLQHADEVIVTEICDSTDAVRCQKRLRDVAQYLARHRITAVAERVRPVEGTAEDALLRVVQDEAADLIVAGAYGHSRLGEWIFGGMTQSLLTKSPVCCLVSH
jgi:nucleotide-binding universal stress UspA family protein